MSKKFLDIKQVKEMLGLSERTVFRLIKKGDLKGFKAGRAWRFTEPDIEDYIQRQRDEAEREQAKAREKKKEAA